MTIDVLEGSLYFKGLLLLIRKDHRITEHEASTMKSIGKSLGLDAEFCDEAINDILENEYIEDTPPKFTAEGLAPMFIRDGLRLAAADGEIHEMEQAWIEAVAESNGIAPSRLAEWSEAALAGSLGARFEAHDLRVRYRA